MGPRPCVAAVVHGRGDGGRHGCGGVLGSDHGGGRIGAHCLRRYDSGCASARCRGAQIEAGQGFRDGVVDDELVGLEPDEYDDEERGDRRRRRRARSAGGRWTTSVSGGVDHASQSRHRYRRYADDCRNVRETRDRRRRRRPTDPRTLWAVAPRVLVVDDEPLVREIVAGYLARDGMEVHEAEDGRAALAWLVDEPAGPRGARRDAPRGRRPLRAASPAAARATSPSSSSRPAARRSIGSSDSSSVPTTTSSNRSRRESLWRGRRPCFAGPMRPGGQRALRRSARLRPRSCVDVGSREVLLDGVAVQLTPKEFDLLADPRPLAPRRCSRGPTARCRVGVVARLPGSGDRHRPRRPAPPEARGRPGGSPLDHHRAASATGSSRDASLLVVSWRASSRRCLPCSCRSRSCRSATCCGTSRCRSPRARRRCAS